MNCGGCGHDCHGGNCSKGVCQPVDLGVVENAFDVSCGDDDVLVATANEIHRLAPNSAPVAIVTGRTFPRSPLATATHVYWLEDGALVRASRMALGTVETIAPQPYPMVGGTSNLVGFGASLYFTTSNGRVGDPLASSLWRVPSVGGGATSISDTDNFGSLEGDSISVSADGVFVASHHQRSRLWSVPLDGGTPRVLGTPFHVGALAAAAGSVYFTTDSVVDASGGLVDATGTTQLVKVAVGSGRAAVVASPANTLAADTSGVYWWRDDTDSGLFFQAHASGAAPEKLLHDADITRLQELAVSDQSICLLTSFPEAGRVIRVTKPLR